MQPGDLVKMKHQQGVILCLTPRPHHSWDPQTEPAADMTRVDIALVLATCEMSGDGGDDRTECLLLCNDRIGWQGAQSLERLP